MTARNTIPKHRNATVALTVLAHQQKRIAQLVRQLTNFAAPRATKAEQAGECITAGGEGACRELRLGFGGAMTWRDTLIRVTQTLILAGVGVVSIAIVGGIAYFFARLMWNCRP